MIVTIAGSEIIWPFLVLLGLGIGTLSGLFGVGGAFLLTPALRILFGIPFIVAIGSDLLLITMTGTIATWKYTKAKSVDFRVGLLMSIGALPGVHVGKGILDWLGRDASIISIGQGVFTQLDLTMKLLFLVLLIGVGVSIARESRGKKAASDEECEVQTGLARKLRGIRVGPSVPLRGSEDRLCVWVPLVLAFAVAVLTGLMGVGGGFIMLPLLVYVLGLSTQTAVGTSALYVVFAAGFGAIANLQAANDQAAGWQVGNVNLLLVLLLFTGSFLGVQLGVRLAKRFNAGRIRRYFSLVLGAGALMILVDMIANILGWTHGGGAH